MKIINNQTCFFVAKKYEWSKSMNMKERKIQKKRDQIRLEKNILLDYIYTFMKNFDISSAVWVLYLDYRGLSLLEIGLLEGIFHIASMLFEVPSGAIADLVGRKKVMIAGRILYVMSAIVQMIAGQFLMFAFAFVLSAFSYNLNSGTEEAFLYDSLKKLKKEHIYIKISGRMNMLLEISSAIATFIGGALAQYSYYACYIFVVLFGTISIIPALFFFEKKGCTKKKTRNETNDSDRQTLLLHAKTCVELCKKDKKLIQILLFFPIIDTFYAIMFMYGQKYFLNLRFQRIEISMIMLLAGIFACLGAVSSKKIFDLYHENAKYILAFFVGIGILGLLFYQIVSSILFFSLATFANATLYPIQSTTLNRRIPSEQRATIISISSMLYSIFMVILFPVCGGLSEIFGLRYVFGGLGMSLILFLLGILAFQQKKNIVSHPTFHL